MTDKTDKKIMNVLMENSRLSYRQIARKANVSVATVMNRVNRLRGEGVIKKYTTELDYEKLGYDVEILVEMKIQKAYTFQMEKALLMNPNVYAIYSLSGDFDLALLAKFHDRRQLNNFIKKLQEYEFVERTHTRFILKTFKEEFVKV